MATGDESQGPDSGSFVERLRKRVGKDVVPRIDLHADEEREASASDSGSGSRGFLRKLQAERPQAERYDVRDEIARGGMGAILRVWDDDLRRNLAMKVMLSRGGEAADATGPDLDEEQLGRFLEEAQITGQLDHPGIVPVHDLGIDADGRVYFTMRLVRGRELKEVFELVRESEEGWTLGRALQVVLKVCEAMAFAHAKGVVHRDLKPANVMVGRYGETYVMDWGLARVLGRSDRRDLRIRPADASAMSLVRTQRREDAETDPTSPLVTMDGDVVGTPSYMAPEQAQGRLEDVGAHSDVFSLGAMLYHLFTGRPPYVRPGERISPHRVLERVLAGPPEPVSRFAPDVPDELVAICEKAMARDPADRYGSMLAVADDLQAFLENRVVKAYETGSVAEFKKWVGRNRVAAAFAAGLIVTVLGSAIGFAFQKDRRASELFEEQERTRLAKDEAERNEETANANFALAEAKRLEAAENLTRARESERLALLSGYQANVISAAYSLDAHDVEEGRKRLADCEPALRGWEWRHLSLRANPEFGVLGERGPSAYDVAVSPDGGRVFVLTQSGKLRILDATSGETLEPTGIANSPYLGIRRGAVPAGFALDATAERVSLVGSDRRVRVFDVHGGELLATLPAERGMDGHSSFTTCVAFHPGGELLASGAEDEDVIVWNLADGSIAHRLPGGDGPIAALDWASDGERLAIGTFDGVLSVWHLESATEVARDDAHGTALLDVRFSPDGALVAAGCIDGDVHVYDGWTASAVRIHAGHEGRVHRVAFDADGERIASVSSDGTVRVWRVAPGGRRETTLMGHSGQVLGVEFVDDELLVSVSDDGTCRQWVPREAARDRLDSVQIRRSPGTSIASHPTRPYAVFGRSDNRAVVFDVETLDVLRVLRGHENYVACVGYSSDGTRVVTGSGDKTARIWDPATGATLHVLRGHEKLVGEASFSPDGTRVATGSNDRRARLWDADTGELLRVFPEHRGRVTALTFVSDDELAFNAGDGLLVVWGLAADEPRLQLEGPERGLLCAAVSPDGALLAAGGRDTAHVFDLETGATLATLRGHERQVDALAWSRDGTRIATGSTDGTVRVWDTETGTSLLILETLTGGPLRGVAFDASGDRLLSIDMQGDVELFEVAPLAESLPPRRRAAGLRARAWTLVDGLFDELFYRGEVVAALSRDPDLDEELRATAIRLAEVRGNDPHALDDASREDLRDAEEPRPGAWAQALARAEAAASMDGNDPGLKLTLGVAQYRNDAFAAAARTLDDARTGDGRHGLTEFGLARRAFLAMSEFRLGRGEQAVVRLRRLFEELEDAQELAADERIGALLEEARATVGYVESAPTD